MNKYTKSQNPGEKWRKTVHVGDHVNADGTRTFYTLEQEYIRLADGTEAPMGGNIRGPIVTVDADERDKPTTLRDPATDEALAQKTLNALAAQIQRGECTSEMLELIEHSLIRRWQGERDIKEAEKKLETVR